MLLKRVHTDIEVGRVTETSAVQFEKQLISVVTRFKLEGNDTLFSE